MEDAAELFSFGGPPTRPDEEVWFTFAVDPVCVQSTRVTFAEGGRSHGYRPKRITEYKARIRAMAMCQYSGKPWEGPVEVLPVTVCFKWPKSTPKRLIEAWKAGQKIYHDRQRDLEDNLLKGVFDSLHGVIYTDDKNIVKSGGREKIYGPEGFIRIGFRRMPVDTLLLPP